MLKEVYNPKAVIPHAASLHQACAHCAIFPTAASRRSLGRVSVPVWPVALSGRLPVLALVGHHPTNKLIGREPIPRQTEALSTQTHANPCDHPVLAPVSEGYPPAQGRLLTCYSPVRRSSTPKRGLSARLACVKHAASVRPEPGSNSPTKTLAKQFTAKTIGTGITNTLLSSQRTTTHQTPTTQASPQGTRSTLLSRAGRVNQYLPVTACLTQYARLPERAAPLRDRG
jgi:hypothetical protein